VGQVIPKVAAEAGVEAWLEGSEAIWINQERQFLDERRTLFEYPQLAEYGFLEIRKYSPHFRIALFGPSRCGKTAIVRRYIYDEFKMKYIPSLESCYRANMNLGNIACSVEIWDSGSNQIEALRNSTLPSTNGYLLVFQMTDLQSLMTLKDTHKKLCDAREFDDSTLDCHLVGTKSDEKLHDVTETKIAEIAKELQCGYSIVSAKSGDNISKPFIQLVDKLYKQNQPPHTWKAHPKYDKPYIPLQLSDTKEHNNSHVNTTVVTGVCSMCLKKTDPKEFSKPDKKKK
jgi:GTPase SAR1 family protein